MKKTLVSLMLLALVVGLVGAGTIAYYYDTETSGKNTFALLITLAKNWRIFA